MMFKHLIFEVILIYRLPCLESIVQRVFFLTAYSGRWSESAVIAECLKQYGFHFLTLNKCSSFCFCCISVIDPISTSRLIYNRNRSKTCQILSDFTGAPLIKLQINLAFGSFLNGCLLIQSRTYVNEDVNSIGPPPVLVFDGMLP